MPESRDQRDLLSRYLLGEASDSERHSVEEQVFASDADLNVLLQAEDELIDDYVRGALSDSDRRLFESHFLCTEERKRRVEALKSFVEVLDQMELVGKGVSSERPRRPLVHAQGRAIARHELTPEEFAQLLNWLDSDYQRAGEKLVNIRRRLVAVFTRRGFSNAEELADGTIDRVAQRVGQIIETYVGDPARYFYAVARAMMLEAARSQPGAALVGSEPASDQTYSCLEKCLEQLSQANRDLILQYYAFEKENKLDNRKELAQSLGISPNALRVRVHNIRKALENCVRSCLKRENEVHVK